MSNRSFFLLLLLFLVFSMPSLMGEHKYIETFTTTPDRTKIKLRNCHINLFSQFYGVSQLVWLSDCKSELNANKSNRGMALAKTNVMLRKIAMAGMEKKWIIFYCLPYKSEHPNNIIVYWHGSLTWVQRIQSQLAVICMQIFHCVW